jgi:hypothetical protein
LSHDRRRTAYRRPGAPGRCRARRSGAAPAQCVEWLQRRKAEILAQQRAAETANDANRARADQQVASIRQALGERAIVRGTATWLQKRIAVNPEAFGGLDRGQTAQLAAEAIERARRLS